MRQCAELDDCSLLEILSKVSDARQLAKCSLVCKRWGQLRWAVSRLHFDFEVSDMNELRDAEDTISSVLHCAKYTAPGCLKELKVELDGSGGGDGDDEMEASGHWLAWAAGSLTSLILHLEGEGRLTWGPAVWNLISCSTAIRSLELSGGMRTSYQSWVSCSLQGLEDCALFSPTPQALLQMLLASCPRLESFRATVCGVQSLSVSNESIRALALYGESQSREVFETFELTVDAPQLQSLLVAMWPRVSIRLRSEDLRTAMLFNSCALDKPCEKLRSLTLLGPWEMDAILKISRFSPMVSKIHLQTFRSQHEITMDNILSSFGNVETIHADCQSLESFVPGGVSKRKDVTVHLYVKDSTPPNVMVLRDLLGVHQVQEIVIHCKDVADWELLTLRPSYECFRVLFDLLLFFPGRISFGREELPFLFPLL